MYLLTFKTSITTGGICNARIECETVDDATFMLRQLEISQKGNKDWFTGGYKIEEIISD